MRRHARLAQLDGRRVATDDAGHGGARVLQLPGNAQPHIAAADDQGRVLR